MLERVGIRLNAAIEEVVEMAFSDTPGLAADDESASSSSSDADERTTLRGTGSAKERAMTSEEERFPTDPILTKAQIVMIRNLNSIPQLRFVPPSLPSFVRD